MLEMGGRLWTIQLLVQTLCLTSVAAFSNGKVTEACGSMMPKHGHAPNTTHAPYTLSVNVTEFSSGDYIQVTISGTTYFEGFLLEARNASNPDSDAVGSFILTNPKTTQLLQCGHTPDSAVSHTSDARQTQIVVIWKAPQNSPAAVKFLVTVVAHYKTFWVKIPGPVVSQSGVTPIPPKPTTPSTTIKTSTPSVLPRPFSSVGCGQQKSCLLDPVGCDPEKDPSCFFLSFAPKGQTVVFELSGPSDGYIAFALSHDTWMGDDDMYLCVRDDSLVDVSAAYVKGRSYPQEASENVLTDVAWRLADGVIQCQFRRQVLVPQDPTRFSLDAQYYLFMAYGEAENGEVHRHDRQPLISSQQSVINGPAEILNGSRSPLLMKFHSVLMLIAWMLAGSTGTFLASYFKPDWPERTLFGQRIWFQVHRGLMILTVLLTCVAFTLPFIYRGGWSKHAGAHPYLGCTVLALALLQPIMATLRPPPDSSRRWVFNWLHWGAGTVAEIMAVAAMFLGMGQQSVLLPHSWRLVVLAGFLAWVVLLRVLLGLHKKGYIKTRFCDFVSKASDTDQQRILADDSEDSTWDAWFKIVALLAFVIGNSGFLISFIHTISGL
ncbi:putative ferric-chelate reductase 1 [Oncorhynchus kisutch]|uniref:Ferric chelate reductase 1 n=1 Tax=Oncorhynchus kisutch TaxID=8019 RepID=A0A8C7H8I0_ONCKI|nr:putative ferric-chelate reductase 1 [Oncorhynchus kisutch]